MSDPQTTDLDAIGREEILGGLTCERCLKLIQRFVLRWSKGYQAMVGQAHRHLARKVSLC
jgi:hypothetical protein